MTLHRLLLGVCKGASALNHEIRPRARLFRHRSVYRTSSSIQVLDLTPYSQKVCHRLDNRVFLRLISALNQEGKKTFLFL